jgi:glycosyltransferase involved in cell wall biosynthesis
MVRIDVLLASYNGASYLAAQLDSLLAQEAVNLRVLIRDDGSRDDTLAIIADYVARFPQQIVPVRDSHAGAGAAANFLRLLALPSDADFFAFCDQDDIWLPQKLQRAVSALMPLAATPALFVSGFMTADSELRPLGRSLQFRRPPGFGNAIVQNIVIGAATVINRPLWQLIHRQPLDASRMVMHDWWIYLLATAFGRVIYEPEPLIIYRQHGANVVGTGQSLAQRWRRLGGFFSGKDRDKVSRQARYFLEVFGDELADPQRRLIEDVYQPGHGVLALWRLLRRDVYGMRGRDDLVLAVRLLLGRH